MSLLILQTFFNLFQYPYYLLIFVVLWLTFIIYNLFISQYRNIPGPLISQIFPLYDLYFFIKGDFYRHLANLHNTYGPVVRIALNRICINDVYAWKKIHSYEFEKTSFYDHSRTVGWSIPNIKDRDLHSSRRRTVTKVFSEANILTLESAVRECGVNVLINKIKHAKAPLNMSEEYLFLTCDIIGKLLFSQEFGLLKDQNLEISNSLKNIFVFLALNAFFPPFRFIGNPHLLKLAYKAKESIIQRKQQLKNNEKVPNDLLGALIESKDPDTNMPISMLDLMEECAGLLVAGSDTSANALTWALYLILKHPKVKQKLVNEIETQFPDKNEKVDYKSIVKKLPYFQNVIKEVLRLYPVVSPPMLRITPKEGLTVQQIFIPKDTEIITNCYAMHHSNTYWNQPEKFNPDRFNEPENNNLDAFLPFSYGPRACTGRYLASLEVAVTTFELFRKFEMRLVNNQELKALCYIAINPSSTTPLQVIFEEK